MTASADLQFNRFYIATDAKVAIFAADRCTLLHATSAVNKQALDQSGSDRGAIRNSRQLGFCASPRLRQPSTRARAAV